MVDKITKVDDLARAVANRNKSDIERILGEMTKLNINLDKLSKKEAKRLEVLVEQASAILFE